MRIYVASSWRNKYQQEIVDALRLWGHEVYDFRNPEQGNHGFLWRDVSVTPGITPEEFRAALSHPIAEKGFRLDSSHVEWANRTLLVLPSGRSAHLEAGRSKEFDIFMPEPCEPELMYKWARRIFVNMRELQEEYWKPAQKPTSANPS